VDLWPKDSRLPGFTSSNADLLTQEARQLAVIINTADVDDLPAVLDPHSGY
jgi:hypothetical protein